MKLVPVILSLTILFPLLGEGFDIDDADPLQVILLECRHPDGPTQEDDLRSFAKSEGLSNSEMSEKLVALVRAGLEEPTDPLKRQLIYSALGGLAFFGSEKENNFVRNVMRLTQDATLQNIAVHVGIRMMPEKWEEWVREVSSDKRFYSLTRFVAYEEAFRIGRNGDEQTRQHVEKVLQEISENETNQSNQLRLRGWANELKAR